MIPQISVLRPAAFQLLLLILQHLGIIKLPILLLLYIIHKTHRILYQLSEILLSQRFFRLLNA